MKGAALCLCSVLQILVARDGIKQEFKTLGLTWLDENWMMYGGMSLCSWSQCMSTGGSCRSVCIVGATWHQRWQIRMVFKTAAPRLEQYWPLRVKPVVSYSILLSSCRGHWLAATRSRRDPGLSRQSGDSPASEAVSHYIRHRGVTYVAMIIYLSFVRG